MRAFLDLHFMKGSRFYLHGRLLWDAASVQCSRIPTLPMASPAHCRKPEPTSLPPIFDKCTWSLKLPEGVGPGAGPAPTSP